MFVADIFVAYSTVSSKRSTSDHLVANVRRETSQKSESSEEVLSPVYDQLGANDSVRMIER